MDGKHWRLAVKAGTQECTVRRGEEQWNKGGESAGG